MSAPHSIAALTRAAYVLAREGVITGLPPEALPPPMLMFRRLAGLIARRRSGDAGRAANSTRALNRLGPSWVKLGQFLATRPDVVGKELASDLASLQDRMLPFPREVAIEIISASLGRDANALFVEISEAVAAASIAQVHRAVRRRDGATVAVKVIRPGVRERFRADLRAFYWAARIQERHIPASRRLRPIAVVDTLAQSASIEMDLRLEAAAYSELGENVAHDQGFRVPAVDWALTGRDCLTMDWVDGIKLSDLDAIDAAGHNRRALAAGVVQHFLRQTLRDGFFHADMHPGNLFVDANGGLVAVDLGIMGRLGRKERRFLAEILYGFINRDYRRVAEVHFEAGYVPRHHAVDSFAQAIRAIGEPIHGQSAQTISMARLLALLFEVTELFDMQTRPELILLQKTMVVVEGVARTLDPDFDMWKTSEPVVGQWIRHHLGPGGLVEDARAGAAALHHAVRILPEIAAETEKLALEVARMAEHGIRLDPETSDAIGKANARYTRPGRISVIVIAVIALILAFYAFLW